ncbi:MAG: hypothetical protein IMF05_02370 [Proteobacteria bacterium]|nr:hypothetical protein [Pseudomonadota bacterium]
MNSASYLKIFLTVTLGFGAMHVGSLLAFLYSPQSFYHGPWEYFGDIAYRVEGAPMRWEGMEYQGQTRSNFLYYQYGHVTTVTTDADGFRARAIEADSYPVMVFGDSTIFGAGLSDEETLPWRLAEITESPVFNGARTSLSNVLAHPALGTVNIVIDAATERNVYPRLLKKRGIPETAVYQPIARKDQTMTEAAGAIPPQRYSLPLILLKIAERLAGDFKTWGKGGEEPYLFLRHRMRREELDETVALIVARSRGIEARGMRYVFLPVPAKQTLYAEDVDDYTRNFIPTLVARLRAEGVEAVDLATPFQAHKDEGLFFPYDTHWNAKGAALAAKVMAEQLFGK